MSKILGKVGVAEQERRNSPSKSRNRMHSVAMSASDLSGKARQRSNQEKGPCTRVVLTQSHPLK